METKEKQEAEKQLTYKELIDENLPGIKGRWRLTYKAKGTRGIENFGGIMIHEYENPFTHKTMYRRDNTGKVLPSYFLSMASVTFNPDKKLQDKLDIAWLLHSPQVNVQGYDQVKSAWNNMKADSNQITLTAMDYQEMKEIEQEDFIDQLCGRLSAKPPRALSIETVRVILSAVGLSARDDRYDKVSAEKKALLSTLKKWVRKDYDNAKKVAEILTKQEYYQIEFDMKEMMRLNIIKTGANGLYKYNDIPIGTHPSSILDFWNSNPEIKSEMMKELAKAQKTE